MQSYASRVVYQSVASKLVSFLDATTLLSDDLFERIGIDESVLEAILACRGDAVQLSDLVALSCAMQIDLHALLRP